MFLRIVVGLTCFTVAARYEPIVEKKGVNVNYHEIADTLAYRSIWARFSLSPLKGEGRCEGNYLHLSRRVPLPLTLCGAKANTH
ncbi:Uncharacterised protein [Shigella flexneri]|uniref:Uncharacterized protein n=1 Tax=Shigella flexneri TaxID=623 RepID=A0A380A5N3_SHIFL|nr:Uncharacterised protein [Shigella flexneri 2a]SRG78273.1 Uncharacterised protein [Shigella flexneri 2a]SUI70353.1 Uncharacterised protein [Shigella flexneri]SUI74009.1 Uncharacterised protein [Shigella flexneri]